MLLVSAILPTRGRQEWARQALACFKAQTYPHKELVIIDDIDEPSFPTGVVGCVHVRNNERDIAKKRNAAAYLANGEIILHWDSDDWSSAERMADQVRALEESGKALTGYRTMLFYKPATKEVRLYDKHAKYILGTSFAYKRAWWQAHPFTMRRGGQRWGEDNDFRSVADKAGELHVADGAGLMVARVHDDHTAPKNFESWTPKTIDALPVGFRFQEGI